MDSAYFDQRVRVVPDWPEPGVLFRDITPLLRDGEAFRNLIDTFALRYADARIDAIAGIDARGFIIGAALAYRLRCGFIPVRKAGKLPYETVRESYTLEYGQATVEVHTDAAEAGEHVLIVDDLIAEKVNAIVIAPGDSQRLIPVLKKAADGGIKIVNIDNALDQEAQKKAGMAPVPFISVDNEKAAYAAAKYLIQGVNEPTEAAILEGIRSASNARQRMEGAKRAFGENASIKLVASESANWKIDEGHEVTQKILRAHPNVKVIFAANDMMGLGALKSLDEAKRSDIRVGAYDALSEAVAEVRSGKLAVTVDQQAAEQGFQGIATALRLLNGETVPSIILIDTRLVTAESTR